MKKHITAAEKVLSILGCDNKSVASRPRKVNDCLLSIWHLWDCIWSTVIGFRLLQRRKTLRYRSESSKGPPRWSRSYSTQHKRRGWSRRNENSEETLILSEETEKTVPDSSRCPVMGWEKIKVGTWEILITTIFFFSTKVVKTWNSSPKEPVEFPSLRYSLHYMD